MLKLTKWVGLQLYPILCCIWKVTSGDNTVMHQPKPTITAMLSQWGAVTLVTLKIHMYPGGYCQTPVTPRIHRVLSGHRIRICSPLANASVKITKNSATSIEYENWDNIPWPHQILRRNYMKCVTGLSSRPDFFKNISNIIWWYHNQNIIKWE